MWKRFVYRLSIVNVFISQTAVVELSDSITRMTFIEHLGVTRSKNVL